LRAWIVCGDGRRLLDTLVAWRDRDIDPVSLHALRERCTRSAIARRRQCLLFAIIHLSVAGGFTHTGTRSGIRISHAGGVGEEKRQRQAGPGPDHRSRDEQGPFQGAHHAENLRLRNAIGSPKRSPGRFRSLAVASEAPRCPETDDLPDNRHSKQDQRLAVPESCRRTH